MLKMIRKHRVVAALAMLAVVFGAGVVTAQVTSIATVVVGRLASAVAPQLAAASLSGCGTSPSVVGNEGGAVITIGSSPGAACTVTFTSGGYSNAPACFALNQTTAANLVPKVSTTTTAAIITFTAGPTAADKINFFCVGVNGG
jgi:hypothetical protein